MESVFNLVSNREDIDGAGGDHTDRSNGDKYAATAALPLPSSVLRSPRAVKRDQRLKRRRGMIRRAAPWLQPSDCLVVPQALARLMILADQVYERLQAQGLFDENGDPRPGVDQLRRIALAEEKLAASLGLTVKSRTELQSGSGGIPVDAEFERRVKKVHAERHGEPKPE
jgi:hypothetical protein